MDKYESCKDCPDRCAVPNCHMTCKGYIARQDRQKEISEKRKVENGYFDYKCNVFNSIHNSLNKKPFRKR